MFCWWLAQGTQSTSLYYSGSLRPNLRVHPPRVLSSTGIESRFADRKRREQCKMRVPTNTPPPDLYFLGAAMAKLLQAAAVNILRKPEERLKHNRAPRFGLRIP